MSTACNRNIVGRKEDHVRICADADNYDIEGAHNDFAQIHFVPNALPELNATEVSPAVDFCNYSLSLPLMISPMSGGIKIRDDFNKIVATIAQEAKIACGLGSMRVLFRYPDMISQFAIKDIARDVPVIANIGGAQLRDQAYDVIFKWCDRLRVDMLSVHLNCGQELFQEDGDRNFLGMQEAIAGLVEQSPCPVIVKETGFGIAPREVRALIGCGVQYIDIAGKGGTNWIQVEAYRHKEVVGRYPNARLFSDWGVSAATVLATLRGSEWLQGCTLVASGGIRDASHIAKSISLGATLTSMALPFARLIINHGLEQALLFVEQLKIDLITIMTLCGAGDISTLRESAVIFDSEMTHRVQQLSDLTR